MYKIDQVLSHNSAELANKQKLWGYYEGNKSFIPIFSREPVSPLKAKTETLIHADFESDVVDLKVGYLYSKTSMTSKSEYVQEVLNTIERNNSITSMNVESGRLTTATGISYRLIYNDHGTLRMKNINPWQVVLNYEEDPYNASTAYYFHDSTDIVGKNNKYCDVYDATTVSYWEYKVTGKKAEWIPRMIAADGSNTELHLFNSLPIIPFINNSLMKGNYENALDTGNAYDDMISDVVSEIRASRLAYLKIWGELNTNVEYTDASGELKTQTVSPSEWLTKFGTMVFGVDDQGNKYGDAQFLEKKLDDAAIEHNLARLRQHFFEESKSIDLKQLSDTANARVFTVKASMMRFDVDASSTETYLRRSINRMLELVSEFEKLSGRAGFDPYVDVTLSIVRSFPTDIDASATALQKLLTVLPVEIAYSLTDLLEPGQVAEAAEKWTKSNEDLTFEQGVL